MLRGLHAERLKCVTQIINVVIPEVRMYCPGAVT